MQTANSIKMAPGDYNLLQNEIICDNSSILSGIPCVLAGVMHSMGRNWRIITQEGEVGRWALGVLSLG